jgi:predicted Zn-dependent peptidase
LERELAEKNVQLALKDEELARKDQQLAAALLSQRDSPQVLQNSIADLRRRVVELERSVQVSDL